MAWPACANGYSAFLIRKVEAQDLRWDEFVYRVDIYCIFCLLQCRRTSPLSHQAFKHSKALIRSSPRAFRSGAISLFALLNALSHSHEVAGQARVLKAHCRMLGNCWPRISHQVIGFIAFKPIVAMPAPREQLRPNLFTWQLFRFARRLADWSTYRYLFPLIVRTGNLGVLSEPSRAVSLAIQVAEPIRVLRSFSSSPQSIESNDGAILV
jgi:hypothetical protein